MANCPKCGYKLRMIDIKAECPKCGVNLLYYNQQERLALDADKAEEEHINFQPKIDRVKFSFVGTKLSIVRLIMLFVPIGMLFLPLVHIKADIPYHSIDTNVSVLTNENQTRDFILHDIYGNQRYYALHQYYKKTFGRRVFKAVIDGGFTCPNKDGSLSDKGCLFCDGGSGYFTGTGTISEQLIAEKERIHSKYPDYSKEDIQSLLVSLGYTPTVRGETLSTEEFLHLSDALWDLKRN